MNKVFAVARCSVDEAQCLIWGRFFFIIIYLGLIEKAQLGLLLPAPPSLLEPPS